MKKSRYMRSLLAGGASVFALASAAHADHFNIPAGDLATALDVYTRQTGVDLIVAGDAVKGVRTQGAQGDLSADMALAHILSGTGFATRRQFGAIAVVHENARRSEAHTSDIADITPLKMAAASSVETVVVTSSKIKGDIQTVPIAITALSQEQLTERQIAGGPDLVKEVPNLTFSKTNFTGYNIEIRGIGTQAISVTTDPAVAVAFNDTPFLRNHFFEQEFYDVAQVEVLRGPQGTLYGRNATAGVVNVVSATPTDQFEAMLSADWGNYHNRRYEGMVNIPIVGDKLDFRLAGEWTKRDGYSFNTLTNQPIDGRDLWSSRATLRWRPVQGVTADFIWEHFSENDDRLRSGKQLCKRGEPPASILGISTAGNINYATPYVNQICVPTSMYSADAFGVPNSLALPYYGGFISAGGNGAIFNPLVEFQGAKRDAYAGTRQSRNLRDIESALNPTYRAKNDTLELNTEWQVVPSLTVNSATGYNADFLWSTEDFNRFNTQPGIFANDADPSVYGGGSHPLTSGGDGYFRCDDGFLAGPEGCIAAGHPSGGPLTNGTPTAYFCDPQLGCSDRLVGEDLSEEHSWQISQEMRLTSNLQGPFNFSVGGNYLHYETKENYYVFFNTLTMFAAVDGLYGRRDPWVPFQSFNDQCVPYGHEYANPNIPTDPEQCPGYIDPHPLSKLDNAGHNYFLSQNPYTLNSYAMFGEAYYDITKDLKLTGGLRWTDDQKHFIEIPSELLTVGYGYPSTGNLDQEWKEWTGRAVINWTPKLDFTDQSMFYASYAHGYKAGGANPPGAVLLTFNRSDISTPTHPKTFGPEFNDAFELGTKNTALDGDLTLNGNVFYYNYKGYQISQIVDRTAVNLNFDATVKGAELQATWSPLPGFKLGFAGGYEDTRIANGSKAIDLMDRTGGNPNWIVVKPFVTQASNCVLPAYVVAYMLDATYGFLYSQYLNGACTNAYNAHVDPVTQAAYVANPRLGYPGFDPLAGAVDPATGTIPDPYTGQNTFNGIDYGPAPNNGAGFYKNVGGKQLPNAPHYTVSLTADYTMPVSADWAATLHGDFYWQSQSWARVFNAVNDKIRGYSSTNLALILTDASGWQVMSYVKNIFDVTAITGTFLNSDDTGLTTNIFLTDPRLYGIRVTKHFDGPDGGFSLFSGGDGKKPQVWLTVGGNVAQLQDNWQKFKPDFVSQIPDSLPNPVTAEKAPGAGFDWEGALTYQPEDSDWVLKAGVRYGRTSRKQHLHKSLPLHTADELQFPSYIAQYFGIPSTVSCEWVKSNLSSYQVCPWHATNAEFVDAQARASERHAILDFTLGKDIGIGTIGGGVRIAQFDTSAHAELNTDPHYAFPTKVHFPPDLSAKYGELYDGTTLERRRFHGIGPEITWDSSLPILGNETAGEIDFDWGVNAAELFGQQSAKIHHTRLYKKCASIGPGSLAPPDCHYYYNTPAPIIPDRSKSVSVPNLGGYVGLSARYSNAKISLGYRADEFFNAMDGGQDAAKKYDRGFYGPYLNLSVGFGG